jgi:ubiquinone/menaquinone biosynthesis C-methylase UbiE
VSYVHGYTARETQRLQEQSLILEKLLHEGTHYPQGSKVLEAGCGVGAQTRILLRRNPGIRLTSIDLSGESIEEARRNVGSEYRDRVDFRQADIYDTGMAPGTFDHMFVCFLLEHLENPRKALRIMGELLRPGGTLTVIEGDHGSGFWTPETDASRSAWDGLITAQRREGHDPNIGRRLYPLLEDTGMKIMDVSPRAVYADQSNHMLLDGVVNQIIAPMVFSAEKQVLEEKLVREETWHKGLNDIREVATVEEGTFFYTWFKGFAVKK